jgi:hypothetical protein
MSCDGDASVSVLEDVASIVDVMADVADILSVTRGRAGAAPPTPPPSTWDGITIFLRPWCIDILVWHKYADFALKKLTHISKLVVSPISTKYQAWY